MTLCPFNVGVLSPKFQLYVISASSVAFALNVAAIPSARLGSTITLSMLGALLFIVIFTVAMLDVLLSLSLTVYVKVSAVALPLGLYVNVPSSLIVILPLTGGDSICIVLGLIVPSGSMSLSKTLMVTGFPWLVVAVSLLAVGMSMSSVRMRTLSITTLPSLSPKPRRSKYSVASVLALMWLMSMVTVRVTLRSRVPLEVVPDMLTLSLKYESPSCWMLSSASVCVSPVAVPARERFWLLRRATSNGRDRA